MNTRNGTRRGLFESRRMSKSHSLLLRGSWACLLAWLAVHLAVDALSPLVPTWDLADSTQSGQLRVFNQKDRGGQYGHPVEIGDFDGDGQQDLVMAPMAAAAGPAGAPGEQRPEAGEVYVYKGNGQLSGTLDRGQATPNALTVWGARPGDLLGTELFTANINGDAYEDLIIGAQNYDGIDDGCTRENSGGVFVIFGRDDLLAESTTVDLAALTRADSQVGVLTILGAERGNRLGLWVEAGDVDGDGMDDLLLGADQAPASDDVPGRFHNGLLRVIYGRQVWPSLIDMATEAQTFEGVSTILGRDRNDHFGSSIHANDLDGDGRDELIVAAALNRLSAGVRGGRCDPDKSSPPAIGIGGGDGPDNLRSNAGETFVFFSPEDGSRFPRLVNLSEPLPASLVNRVTEIHGGSAGDLVGEELTSGDFNGDGFVDIVLGGLTATNPSGVPNAGKAHVVYWKSGLEGTTIDLATTDGLPPGVVVSTLYGLEPTDILGDTLSAADFNNDGYTDLAVAAPHARVKGLSQAGLVAVVLGGEERWPELWAPQADELPPGLQLALILGADAFDLMSYSMEARDYDLDGYADLFPNAMHGDGAANAVTNTGGAHLVSGYDMFGTSLTVNAVEPSEAFFSRETTVVISGTGFTTDTDTRVYFGEREADEVVVLHGRQLEARITATAEDAPIGEDTIALRVETMHGSVVLEQTFRVLDPGLFIRGDTDLSGTLIVSDPVRTLNFLFLGGVVLECPDAADANDNAEIELVDAVYTLNFLFTGGPPPPPPFPAAGLDPSEDTLGCR